MQLFTINQESLKNVQTLLWKDVKIIKVFNISSDVVKKKSLYNFIINDNYKKLNGLDVRWKVLWILLYQKLHIDRFSDYFLHSPVLAPVCTRLFFIAPVKWCGAERCWCKYTGVHHISLSTPVCSCGAKIFWCKHTGAWWIFSFACTGAFKNWSFAPVLCTGVVHDFGAHHIPG